MSDLAVPDAYRITFLGSTELYDVYDVVIYPGLVRNADALLLYKQGVFGNLERAKLQRRKVWGAVDLSRLNTGQLITLAYRTVLPFIREPMIFKVYGIMPLTALDESTKTLNWLMQHTFKMGIMPSRDAALPPGFVVEDRIR